MKKNIIIICTLLMMSCSQQTANRNSTDYKIDLKEVDTPSFYDYFSKIEITPLESSEEALIEDVGGFTYHAGKLHILDRRQRKVFIFDDEGKLLNVINKHGNGPGEYSDLSDFRFNPFTGDLELLSPMIGILRYDSLGQNFKEKIPLPSTVSAAHKFVALNKNTYLYFCDARKGNKMVIYDVDQKKIVSEMYDLPKFLFFKTFYHHTYSPFYIYEDKVHFVQAYNGDVFTLEDNYSLVPKYHWDFGEQNFDISGLKDESYQFYIKYAHTVGAKYANTFISYIENSHYYVTGFTYNNNNWTLMYDKQSKKHVLFDTFKEGHRCIPALIDESGIYYILDMPKRLNWFLNIEELDDANKAICDNIKEDDNPVVIKYVFK